MFGIVKKIAAKPADLSDVESWIIGNSLRFAAEITAEFREVPQILAASEGLSFFLHALRRTAFKPGAFKAWDNVFEPARKQMMQLFAMTMAGWSGSDLDRSTMANDAEHLNSIRHLEYQTLPFLAGDPNDRQTVVHSAGRHLTEFVDAAHRDALIAAVHRVLSRVVTLELPEQAARLEQEIYGRRAA